MMPSSTVQDYHVGWICALNIELTAAMAMLDEEHEMIAGQDPQDHNSYVLGRIHQHNVVIACMPEGVDGLVPAANVAKDMARTFPALRVGLMVGIGGGIPDLSNGIDIRLGDIVVSKPEKTWGGVVQYDKGKAEDSGKFVVKGLLNQPPPLLLQTLAQLRARHGMRPSKVSDYITEAIERNPMMEETGFTLPSESDCFYCGVCHRDIESPAGDCEGLHAKRKRRKNNKPVVHYGIIASGNQVVKDAAVRDRLRDEFNAFCVEMEAAGLMNAFPCLVIRGICDYADLHKNDAWHPYAAITAAAYAKEFLQYISPAQASQEQPIKDVLGLLDEIRHTSNAQLEATKAQTQQNQTQYESEKHHQCHQTFKIGPYEAQKDLNPERVAGTCQWVLSHSQYLQWLRKAHDDLLWISADPGCGKSVLARSIIDNELRHTDQHTVCYFFFKDNEEQDNVATALCALLHQLFTRHPELIQHAIPVWEKIGDKLVRELAELWRLLLAVARDDQALDVTCVLDALDECRLSDRRWLIEMLSRFHTQTSASSSTTRRGRLKFLVTSRPYDDIQAEFQKTLHDLPTIRLRGEEENDYIRQEIDLVIRMRVGKLATDLKLDDDIKDRLETRLLEMEHRTYLWLYLAIESIHRTYRNSLRPEEVSIKSLPSSVEDAYEKILSRVDQEQRGNVKKILQIVVGARRPLHVEEIAIALGIATSAHPKSLHQAKLDPSRLENNICDWCGLFVFINHARIYLIHQTAKEFLVSESGCTTFLSGWKSCLDPRGIEREMAHICVKFLSFNDIEATADSLTQKLRPWVVLNDVLSTGNPIESFLAYSAEHWPSHLREAYLPHDDLAGFRILEFYQVNSRLYNIWFPIFWQAISPYDFLPKMSPIRLGGLLGHENILELTLQRNEDYDIDESDRKGQTALIWASEYGHAKVVQTLLERGADVNAQGGEHGNALQAASEGGHEKVVQMLLERGADVNAQGGQYSNALQAASAGGHEKVVQMLLDCEADVHAQGGEYDYDIDESDRKGQTALIWASEYGHAKVVQTLLERGADVNAQGGEHGNALQAASEGGHEKVVQMLLERGADVNAQGGRCGNALQAASEGGHEEVVQTLLERGADVNAQGGRCGNALQAASFDGHEKVVQTLLERGADVNAQGGFYGNALQAASEGGHVNIVQTLLERGADVNAQGGEYGNALQVASYGGLEEMVQILLDWGAKVNIQGGFFGNALQAALVSGREKVMQMLLDYGADVNTHGGEYGNALQAASEGGHEKVVQTLLDRRADVNAQGGEHGNALQAASEGGHEEVVQTLLEREADVNGQGGENGNALQAASEGDPEEVVQILLDWGADVHA
ncbi:uncharacterized protein Z518_08874 [Rhinocladiella mackenziei CBS 650.93]|uniref:Rhinocladiella mackenziei CBS 650.93 unplaced genomic scaffold supercont1.7, whole genome shotgun sequence n=1 Tax=Rhinocladiella mackenziei CBS 650.93 TaxID=1442369 RepID=A0A0D2I5S9_9EURO|nr:uncharacterized protein Z518_08874 [Rhinocladiella mackenziei CBS 650.93]KIX01149.1 hypothetical protein Z518_08874 [Rhinocladiella mackenziei CBS 650.93]